MKKIILIQLIFLLGLQQINAQKSVGLTFGYSNPVNYNLTADKQHGFTGTLLAEAFTSGSLIGLNYKTKKNKNIFGVGLEFGSYNNSPYKDVGKYNRYYSYNTVNINYIYEHILKDKFMFGVETGLLLQTIELMQERYIPKTFTSTFTNFSVGFIPKIGYYYPIKKSNFTILGEIKYKYNFPLSEELTTYERIDNIGILIGVNYKLSKR